MSISIKKHDYVSFFCCLVQQANKNENSLWHFLTKVLSLLSNPDVIPTTNAFLSYHIVQLCCQAVSYVCAYSIFATSNTECSMFILSSFALERLKSLPSNTGCCLQSLRSSHGVLSSSSELIYEKTSTQTIPVHTLRNLVKSLQNSSCSAQTKAGGVQTLNTHI